MKVIIDTTVWSLFLRRAPRKSAIEVERLRRYIKESRALMLGIVRQELLSGIKEQAQFDKLGQLLEGFTDLLATSEDHRTAAQFFNDCRRNGIQGSPVDFLICAIAHRINARILTTDQDFVHYAEFIPIKLDDWTR